MKELVTINTVQNDNDKRIAINETDNLNIMIRLDQSSRVIDCKGSCTTGGGINVDISCNSAKGQDLNVSVKGKVTEKHSGKWNCSYSINIELNQTTQTIRIANDFRLDVNSLSLFSFMTWVWISGILVVVVVLLIIIIQTWCIVHFKRKAKAVRREAQWSSRKNDDTEENSKTVRYSKMPGLKKKEVLVPESRESAIYEVLENIRDAPEPPPVESLPGKKTEPASPVPPESPASTSWTFNSLLRRKNKKPEEPAETKTSTIDKRTTMDRIKERPPLPAPIEEDFYEAVETPPPLRKAMKNHVAKEKSAPKEDFRAFAQPSKPKGVVPLPTNVGVAPPLNAMLKQAVEKRNQLNPVQPQLPPPKPKTLATPKEPRQTATLQPIPKRKPWQNDSTLPKTNQWPKEPAAPKQKPWQEEARAWQEEAAKPRAKVWPKEPTAPNEKVWPREPTAPKEKVWPREPIAPQEATVPREAPKQKVWRRPAPPEAEQKWQEEPQRPIGSLRPNVTPYNPGLPPPDAPLATIRTPWGEAMPPRPTLPVKPKQLHPLPHPPVEPESMHVETDHFEDGDSDDSEFSVYDELPPYPIYNM